VRPVERDENRDLPLSIVKLSIVFLTTMCIIYVDFPSFPVRHAKVSRSLSSSSFPIHNLCSLDTSSKVHISLMDSGCAFFIILNGLSRITFVSHAKKGILNIALWAARFALTKSTNYYVPDEEYGKYCNFFGYIGFVQIIAGCLSMFDSGVLAIAFMCLHELIFPEIAFFGYLALFYTSNAVGYQVIRQKSTLLFGAFCLIPLLLSELEIIFPLRGTANCAFCIFFCGIFYFVLVIGTRFPMNYCELSLFYKTVDSHIFVFFCLGNVMTGFINLIIDANHSSFIFASFAVVIVFVFASISTMLWHRILPIFGC
jgi:hypothetical protein